MNPKSTTRLAHEAMDKHDPEKEWDRAYRAGWEDRNAYKSAEDWPFVQDTPNPYRIEDETDPRFQ